MVLTRGFACAVPVVASAIPGYEAVMTEDTGVLVPPGDDRRARRRGRLAARGRAATRRARRARPQVAIERYSWDTIAERLEQIYEDVCRLKVRGILRSPWTRGGIVLAFLSGVGALLWFDGPEWAAFRDAFRSSSGSGSRSPIGFNLLSVVARAFAGRP